MTQQKQEPSMLESQEELDAGQDVIGERESVDLIEFGMREDIDWQAEGQRVLEMLSEPLGMQRRSPIQAA
jgi:hypothetical protein